MEDLIGKQFGTYQIIAQCGQGGMATVYKAYQPSMDRYVALKVLPRFHSSDPEFIGRFEQEAKALAQLQHPHILPVFDYGESEGYTYFVMPLMQDGNLAELLVEERLSLQRINQIISQIGGALQYAHSRGFIHRDVKPSNILLDDSGNCTLMDFGIAKIIEGSKEFTQTGGILGTPAYMSPEQGSGQKIDHRSDIYSLGIILYEMVTGKPPFEAETPVAVIFKHVHDPLPPPSKLVPDLSEDVERVLLKSLTKNPEDRYQTVREMVDALSAAVSKTLRREPTLMELPPTEKASMPELEQVASDAIESELPVEERLPETQVERAAETEIQTEAPTKKALPRPLLILSGVLLVVVVGVVLIISGGLFQNGNQGVSAGTEVPDGSVASLPTNTPGLASVETKISPTETSLPTSAPTDTVAPPITPALPYISVPTSEAVGEGLDSVIFLGFDPSVPPFDNPLVRQAIASAVDRVGLIDRVKINNPEGRFTPATSVTPPDILGFELYGEVGHLFDEEMAQQLLAEAGYPNGDGFPTITLYHNAGEAATVNAQYVSEDLSETLGITVETSPTQLNYPDSPEFYIMGWVADYLDPHNFLYDPFCGEINRDFIGSDDYWAKVDSIHAEENKEAKSTLIMEYSQLFCIEIWNPHLDLSQEYKRTLDLALDEENDSVARMLYVEAEIILVQTETFVIPLYHWASTP
jgi:serine/threonine protein kinase